MVTNANPGPVQILSAPATQGTFNSGTGDWNIGNLAVGAGATLTLTMTPTNVGEIRFSSRVRSEVPDRNTANDTVTHTVIVPNQAPVVTFLSSNVVVLEDAGLQTVASFVTFSGPESGQTLLSGSVTNSNPGIFAGQPAVGPSGTLTFTPAANSNGTATVTVVVQDDGGTANGGVDKTTNTFTIMVTAIPGAFANGSFESPDITIGQALASGSTNIAGWVVGGASTVSWLDINNAGAIPLDGQQYVAFNQGDQASGATLAQTFSNVPGTAYSVSYNVGRYGGAAGTVGLQATVTSATGQVLGTLSSPAPSSQGWTGSQTFTFVPTTRTSTLTFLDTSLVTTGVDVMLDNVSVTAVNNPPVQTFATNNVVVLQGAGAQFYSGFLSISNEPGQSIANNTVTSGNAALFSVAPAIALNGALTFTPSGTAGTATVTVVTIDDGGTANGGVDRATNTFAIAVLAVNQAPGFTFAAGTPTDGVMEWVESLGLMSGEGRRVITDSSGNVVVAGNYFSGTSTDIIVVKYSYDGTPVWTNTFDGVAGGGDEVSGLALDASGNVFVTGSTFAADTNFVTIKYLANGTAAWTNFFSGTGNDSPSAIAVDGAGNVIVTGTSQGGFWHDYLTIKYSGGGTPVWTNRSTYFVSGNDYARSVAVDAGGDVYVTGDASNTDFVYGYTLKYSGADGTPLWTNQLSFNSSSTVAVAVDASGDVLVAGSLVETSFFKFAVVKYTGAGVPVWTNLYERSSVSQRVRGLAVDGSGNAIVTGETWNGSNYDYSTLKYLANGTPAWTNHFADSGGGSSNVPVAVVVNPAGDVFVTGESTVSNGRDYLTVKYTASGAGVWTNRYNDASNLDDAPSLVTVDANANVYVTGTAEGQIRTIKYAFLPAYGGNQTVPSTVSAVTVTNFIASSTVGSVAEAATQVITNYAVVNDNPALFAVQPAIGTNGTLTYQIAGLAGSARVTVTAQDDGGTDNGGADTSAARVFTITVYASLRATAYVWNGGSGDWNTSASWTPSGVPGAFDSAQIAAGTAQLTNGVSVRTLTLAGGTLAGAGSITVRSNLNWSGGTMAGSGTTTIAGGATLTASGVADKGLNRRLDNYGAVTWTGGRITGDSSPVLNNYAGALFDAQTDTTLFESSDGTVKTFYNSGTVRKSAGTGTSVWRGVFSNAGTLEIRSGIVSLSGDYAPAAGGSLRIFIGGVTAGTQFGQLLVGGTATLNGALDVVMTNSFVPVSGSSFLVVDSTAGSGAFSAFTGGNLGGITLSAGYSGGDVTLAASTTIASLPPLRSLLPQMAGAERSLRWPGGAAGYELQMATSINGPWIPVQVPVAQENGASVVRVSTEGTRFYRLVPPASPRSGNNPPQ
ncbi:MAG: DUF642 domain-containing protein [Limisphaerales bacterium]